MAKQGRPVRISYIVCGLVIWAAVIWSLAATPTSRVGLRPALATSGCGRQPSG